MMHSKYFISLTHTEFNKVTSLLGSKNQTGIEKLVEAAPRSNVNPVPDDKVVNALLFNGNILMDIL